MLHREDTCADHPGAIAELRGQNGRLSKALQRKMSQRFAERLPPQIADLRHAAADHYRFRVEQRDHGCDP